MSAPRTLYVLMARPIRNGKPIADWRALSGVGPMVDMAEAIQVAMSGFIDTHPRAYWQLQVARYDFKPIAPLFPKKECVL